MSARTALAAVIAAGTVGCSPISQYRYSAVTPTAQPIAWDGVVEREGFARFEGTVVGSSVNQNLLPQINSTALMVPQWTVEGAAVIAVAKYVELGVRGAYSAYQWTQPSAFGTMPVPDAPPTWGAGPEMRLSIPVDKAKHFAIGIVGNVMVTSVPYAEWTLTGPLSTTNPTPCVPSATCVQTTGVNIGNYTLSSTQTETHFVWTLGFVPSYSFGPEGAYGHVFVGLTATTGFQNLGFTDTAQTGSTVNTFWPLFVASAGYGGSIDALRLSGAFFKPLTDGNSPVDYGFGFMFTVGVAAELWEPRHHGQATPDPAPPETPPPPPPGPPPPPPPPPAVSPSPPASPPSPSP
jgi:hypothetical protein